MSYNRQVNNLTHGVVVLLICSVVDTLLPSRQIAVVPPLRHFLAQLPHSQKMPCLTLAAPCVALPYITFVNTKFPALTFLFLFFFAGEPVDDPDVRTPQQLLQVRFQAGRKGPGVCRDGRRRPHVLSPGERARFRRPRKHGTYKVPPSIRRSRRSPFGSDKNREQNRLNLCGEASSTRFARPSFLRSLGSPQLGGGLSALTMHL